MLAQLISLSDVDVVIPSELSLSAIVVMFHTHRLHHAHHKTALLEVSDIWLFSFWHAQSVPTYYKPKQLKYMQIKWLQSWSQMQAWECGGWGWCIKRVKIYSSRALGLSRKEEGNNSQLWSSAMWARQPLLESAPAANLTVCQHILSINIYLSYNDLCWWLCCLNKHGGSWSSHKFLYPLVISSPGWCL